VSIAYFVLIPGVVVASSFLYNFLWKVIHEYTHLAALKLIAGKELYSYKVNLKPHWLAGDWVSASVTWKARTLTKKEHAIVAIAPHILELIACFCFVASGLLLLGSFLRDHYYIFFLWSTFSFCGVIDLLSSARADSDNADLNVFADCCKIDRFEVRYLAAAFSFVSIIAGSLFIWIVL